MPLIILTVLMTVGIGLTMASVEKKSIMKNWEKNRCRVPVMFTGSYFKPSDDPRTPSEFSKDNFEFCMKQLVEEATQIAMMPVVSVFGKQASSANVMNTILGDIRKTIATIYSEFMSFLEPFVRRYNLTAVQLSLITSKLRSAMRRVNAIATSTIYIGLTLTRGLMNMVNFIIKVIIIILGILVAIIIILIFFLFPIIPLILTVIGAILAVAIGATAGTLDSYRESFCFAEGTKIAILTKEGNIEYKSIETLEIGDTLAYGCGKIEAYFEMGGAMTPLYYINGIYVSGSHLVESTDRTGWKSVSSDERAQFTNRRSSRLFCLNTEHHKIPVQSTGGIIYFKDWEEIEEDDLVGQYGWNYCILGMLNKYAKYNMWKESLSIKNNIPLLGGNTPVITNRGLINIKDIVFGDRVLDVNGELSTVLGFMKGKACNIKENHNDIWYTNIIKYDEANDVWVIDSNSTMEDGVSESIGYMLLTESGSFTIQHPITGNFVSLRDFTEVGHDKIHKTYPFVESRLRLSKKTEDTTELE